MNEHINDISDIQFKLIHGDFEENIPEVCNFAHSDGNMFTFTFIDPTGWTGFGLNAIKPLLRLKYSEVLINFMTKDIMRFVEDQRPELHETFVDLYGNAEVINRLKGLAGHEREEAIVEVYRRRLKEAAGFGYVASSVVLNPLKDRTHFHLIYGTRNLKGLQVFRETDKSVMEIQKNVRNITQQNQRISSTGQGELFEADVIDKGSYIMELRDQSIYETRKNIEEDLRKNKCLSYDYILGYLERPLIYETDIKQWLKEWEEKGFIEFQGLKEKEKTPKATAGHQIICREKR